MCLFSSFLVFCALCLSFLSRFFIVFSCWCVLCAYIRVYILFFSFLYQILVFSPMTSFVGGRPRQMDRPCLFVVFCSRMNQCKENKRIKHDQKINFTWYAVLKKTQFRLKNNVLGTNRSDSSSKATTYVFKFWGLQVRIYVKISQNMWV